MFTAETARRLAQLSKISFTDIELKKITDDMTEIIALMDKVKEFNENTEPFTLPSAAYSSLRDDITEPSNSPDEITRNADISKNGSFVVPKVV